MTSKNSPKKQPQARKFFPISQKIISILFLFISLIIFVIIVCFSWTPYCGQEDLLLPNIISLIISLLIAFISYFILRKINIKQKTFQILLIAIFIITFLVQMIIIKFTFFYTGWDMAVLNLLSDSVAQTGSISDSSYLSQYPNNIPLVAILSLLKSIPGLGEDYTFILSINALVVNLAGLFTCLVIKKISKSTRLSLASLFIIIPLLLLSPWILIPYSDTFAVLSPILILYLYLSNIKPYWKYGSITILGSIGYFIKPSVAIIIISIFTIELISRHWNKKILLSKTTFKTVISILGAICLAFILKSCAYHYIGFQQDTNIKSISNPAHYLAMGQNDETCGVYSGEDSHDAQQGTSFEINKALSRFSNRSCKDHFAFFTKKLLVNYNDGTFAWGKEGNFYNNIPERNSRTSRILSDIYYDSGKYHYIFTGIEQLLWIFVLFSCIFIYKKSQTKTETILQLTIVGLFLFVMLFEARARYLFAYAPIFITCAMLGISQLKNSASKLITQLFTH